MNRRGFLGGLLKGAVVAVASTSAIGSIALKSNPVETYASSNIIDIYSIHGFPAPVDGVITLLDNTNYLIYGNIEVKDSIKIGMNTSFSIVRKTGSLSGPGSFLNG